jgi:hypothetical protein
MPRWAPRLFAAGLLLLLGAVLGHAAEHEGWIKGLFHCSAVEACHAEDDAAPCDNGGCHSHDEIDSPDLALPAAPAPEMLRALFEAPDFVQTPLSAPWAPSLRPDVPITAMSGVVRLPTRSPLLI